MSLTVSGRIVGK